MAGEASTSRRALYAGGEDCEEAAAVCSGGGAEQDEDEDSPTQDQLLERKEANIRALLSNRYGGTYNSAAAAHRTKARALNAAVRGALQPAGVAEGAAAQGAVSAGGRAGAAGPLQEPAPQRTSALRSAHLLFHHPLPSPLAPLTA